MRERISACVIAGNEERNIRRCLESITWADELIVVDSFSADRTPAIAREYTDRVYQHEWLGYIGQKNLIKDMAAGPWILFLDADEEVSMALRDEILAAFEAGECAQVAGYEFPRMVRYLGRWIRHGDWYPDVKLRLFRKALGTCGGKEPHDRTTVNGPVKRLRGHIHHYTYDDIPDQIATLNRFTTITAQTKLQDGQAFFLPDLFLRPLIRFLRGYLLRRGFLDGLPGIIIAATAAYAVFIKYAKVWELELQRREAAGSATHP